MGMRNGAVLMKPVCKDGINIDEELEKLGVQLQVKVDGVLVEWERNGHIAELYGAEKAEIRLTTCDKNTWGFNVAPYNPNKDVKRVVDSRRPEKPSVPKAVTGAKNYSKIDGRKIYRKTVSIDNGTRTNYPGNCIRLVHLLDYHLKITEVGIVVQGQEGYLTVQPDVYEGVCYQKDDKLVCPAFEKWPSLVEFLRQIQAQGGFAELPHILNNKPATTPKKKTFRSRSPNVGRVKFFNLHPGFGVVETIWGDAYVESGSIISDKKPLVLPRGAEVAFKNILRSTEGALKWKVLGVRVV